MYSTKALGLWAIVSFAMVTLLLNIHALAACPPADIPCIAEYELSQIKIYSNAGAVELSKPASAQCLQNDALIGGSCLNYSNGGKYVQVGIGPIYSNTPGPQSISTINCGRYTTNRSLQVQAFAVCMRLPKSNLK
jgi:hypothetical protein